MLTVTERQHVLHVESKMQPGVRVLLLLGSLVPLVAPYELIVRPAWRSYATLPFLFVLAVSAGATLVSVLLAWSALAGLNKRLAFDRSRQLFSYASGAPLVRWRTTRYPLGEIAALDKATHEWSDGGPSYTFVVRTKDGRTFASGASWSAEEIDTIVSRVAMFLRAGQKGT